METQCAFVAFCSTPERCLLARRCMAGETAENRIGADWQAFLVFLRTCASTQAQEIERPVSGH